MSSLSIHGLHGHLVKLIGPPALTLDELQPVFKQYPDLGPAQKILWHSPRPLSRAALVATASGHTVLVKRYPHLVRTPAQLSGEHDFIAHLRHHQFPAVQICATPQGQTAVEQDNWVYEIQHCAVGLDLYRQRHAWTPFLHLEHAYQAGGTLARLHQASAGYCGKIRSLPMLSGGPEWLMAEDPINFLRCWAKPYPNVQRYLADYDWQHLVEQYVAPVQQHARRHSLSLEPLWTHNDWHGSNLFWSTHHSTTQVSMVVDFGLSNCASAVFDLAVAIERSGIRWLAQPSLGLAVPLEHAAHRPALPYHLDQIKALLAGYQTQRPLCTDEKHALLAVLPVAHCDFAWSELIYFLEITQNSADADSAWLGYFLGHVQWFQSPAGQALLQQLSDFLF